MSSHSPVQVGELERLLREISAIIKRRGRDILADFPITPPQFMALQALRHLQNPTMSQLCEDLALASSTVTDLVDRMERNEMVERVRDCEDRRVIRLKVTQKGLDVVEAVIQNRQRYLGVVFDRLDDETVGTLARVLSELRGAMREEESARKS